MDVAAKVIWVLAGCLLTASPSRITPRIYIGCLNEQSANAIPYRSCHCRPILTPVVQPSSAIVVEGTCLGRHDSSNIADEFIVESSSHENGLRERCGDAEVCARVGEVDTGGVCHSMKSFLPPCVRRQTKTRYSRAGRTSIVQLLGGSECLDQSAGSGKRVCICCQLWEIPVRTHHLTYPLTDRRQYCSREGHSRSLGSLCP